MSGDNTDTKVDYEWFYKNSINLVNAYFDKKLSKRSFFTSIKSIELARQLELAKIEKQFFGRYIKDN